MNAKTELRMFEMFFIFLLLTTNTACAAVSYAPIPGVLSVPAVPPLPADGVQLLAHGGTLWGLSQALKGVQDTMILVSPSLKQFLVAWPWKECQGWCFVLVDTAFKQPLYWHEVVGNHTTPENMKELASFAYDNGWTKVDPRALVVTPLAKGVDLAVKAANAALWNSPVFTLLTVEDGFDIPASFIPCTAAECEDY